MNILVTGQRPIRESDRCLVGPKVGEVVPPLEPKKTQLRAGTNHRGEWHSQVNEASVGSCLITQLVITVDEAQLSIYRFSYRECRHLSITNSLVLAIRAAGEDSSSRMLIVSSILDSSLDFHRRWIAQSPALKDVIVIALNTAHSDMLPISMNPNRQDAL